MPRKSGGGGGSKKNPEPVFNEIYGTDEPVTIDYIDLDSTTLGPSSTEGADKIWGYAGIDLIDAEGGDDVVYGGSDDDIIFGGTGNDTLWGDEGDDIIDGGEDNDTLYGGDGNDILIGSNGDDTVNGGAGDDQIIEGAGSDTIDGGEGIDTVYFAGLTGDYVEETVVIGKGKNKVTATTYTNEAGEVDTFVNVENFVFIDTVIDPPPPTQAGTVDFEGGDDLGFFYADGPNNSYLVSQLTNGPSIVPPFEFRDTDAAGDFDYDDDGDNEFKIWTTDGTDDDPNDGITHELNLLQADGLTFGVVSIRIEDLDADEIVTLEYYSADGLTLIGTETVTTDSVDLDGEIYTVNQTDVGQFAVNISDGGTVYIDDIVLA